MKNKKTAFIVDLIVAVLALALAIVMLPPFGIGQKALNLLFAIGFLVYAAFLLVPRLAKAKGKLLLLGVTEIVAVALLALALVLQQFNVFHIAGVCRFSGLVLWVRGACALTRNFIVSGSAPKKKYAFLSFLLSLFFVTFGTFMFAMPFISDEALTWIFCVGFFIVTLIFGSMALLHSPVKK